MDARKQALHALVHDFTCIQTLCSRALLVERSVNACGQALIREQKDHVSTSTTLGAY